MNPMQNLPMGFGMALLQNEQAFQAFNALSPAQQQEIIQQTHAVSSKAQMKALVSGLTTQSGGLPPQTM